ncbi:polyenoic fatty acid isomerase-like [Pecten maximus]|uniref:polyenoic fatty acid isomerase-like n=1 Tax=Pecten maximus TaxID=6579 RepID=UPI0014591B51|nr:polyenoic fatty acid isomerase-like [Pecten maximus]
MPTLEQNLIEELKRELELNKKHHNHGPPSSEEDDDLLPIDPSSGFRYIRGPKNLDDKIAVVGAGPSGVHMALKLKEAGFQNVIVFEKEDKVGGKSKTLTYRDIPHEMGTCYTQADYTEVYQLLDKYDAGELLPMPTATMWIGQKVYTRLYEKSLITEAEGRDEQTLFQVPIASYRLSSLMFSVLPAAQSLLPNATQGEIVTTFFNAIQKYMQVHIQLFGAYEGELMPRPSNDILENELNMTFLEFLKEHDIEILQNYFLLTQTTQGYGHLDEIPALYGLTWNTPSFIFQALNPPSGEISTIKVLSQGYQALWEAIVEQECLNVRLSSPVMRINRRKMAGGGRKGRKDRPAFQIEYVDGPTQRRKKEPFDFVVLTTEMKLMSDLDIIDFNKEEKSRFKKMNRYYYTTSLVDTKEINGTERGLTPESYFADNINSKVDGSVWVKRDSFNSLQYNTGANYTDNLYPGADGRFDQTSVYYQFTRENPDKDELENELREHIEQREGAEVLNLLRVFVWDYFPQFSVADIASGITWDIFEMQGKYGMWYAGSSVYFESVKSVIEYNNLMFRQYELPQP